MLILVQSTCGVVDDGQPFNWRSLDFDWWHRNILVTLIITDLILTTTCTTTKFILVIDLVLCSLLKSVLIKLMCHFLLWVLKTFLFCHVKDSASFFASSFWLFSEHNWLVFVLIFWFSLEVMRYRIISWLNQVMIII